MTHPLVTLRPARIDDLDFILALEADAQVGPFIRPWPWSQHEAALGDPSLIYRIAEHYAERAGFVILRKKPERPETIEFVRLAVADRRKGIGRATIEAVKTFAIQDLRLASIWLEVFPENPVAQQLYKSLGFHGSDQRATDNGFGGRPGHVIRMEHKFD